MPVPFWHQQPHTPMSCVQPGEPSGLGNFPSANSGVFLSTAFRGAGMMTTECEEHKLSKVASRSAANKRMVLGYVYLILTPGPYPLSRLGGAGVGRGWLNTPRPLHRRCRAAEVGWTGTPSARSSLLEAVCPLLRSAQLSIARELRGSKS